MCSEESEAGTVIDHSVYSTLEDLREGAVQNSLAGGSHDEVLGGSCATSADAEGMRGHGLHLVEKWVHKW